MESSDNRTQEAPKEEKKDVNPYVEDVKKATAQITDPLSMMVQESYFIDTTPKMSSAISDHESDDSEDEEDGEAYEVRSSSEEEEEKMVASMQNISGTDLDS